MKDWGLHVFCSIERIHLSLTPDKIRKIVKEDLIKTIQFIPIKNLIKTYFHQWEIPFQNLILTAPPPLLRPTLQRILFAPLDDENKITEAYRKNSTSTLEFFIYNS